jgi:hypothetical protein
MEGFLLQPLLIIAIGRKEEDWTKEHQEEKPHAGVHSK